MYNDLEYNISYAELQDNRGQSIVTVENMPYINSLVEQVKGHWWRKTHVFSRELSVNGVFMGRDQ